MCEANKVGSSKKLKIFETLGLSFSFYILLEKNDHSAVFLLQDYRI